MLVLSRRLNEKILLPTIDVTIQVVGVKPGVVRLGVEAPKKMPVLREEVYERNGGQCLVEEEEAAPAASNEKMLNHLLRNCLNIGSVGVSLLRQQLAKGMTQEAMATIGRMENDLQKQQQRLEKLSETPATNSVPCKKTRKGLLVEDDQTQCELLAGLLRMAGLDMATAGDGADALDYLKSPANKPDFLLLDMLMPRCDGPTTVRHIRENPALEGVKIFALSGYAPERFNLDPRAAGITRWFRKPINPEILLRDLRQELDREQ